MFELYTKGNGCGYCVKAKSLLDSQGLKYKEHVIGIHIMQEEFLKKFPNARTVPQIVFDDFYIGGYTDLVEHLNSPEQELLAG